MTSSAYIPQDLYDIRIYDHEGKLYRVLRGWDRLEYSQRLNDPWNHSIQITLSPDNPLCQELRDLPMDYFTLILRYDPIAQTNDLVYEGFHATTTEQTRLDGNIFFNLYGGGYTKLLDRRLVLPPPNQENNEKTGYGETIIKDFVYECCVRPTGMLVTTTEEERQSDSTNKEITIQDRLETVFIDYDRQMPGFHIVPTQNRGERTSYSARFTNLESVVKAVIEKSTLDYGIYGSNPPGEFWFDCRPLWGLDRSVGNGVNAPTVFALEIGNMLIPILSTNHRHEKNYFYAGGSGEGELRQIMQYWDIEAIEQSPWGRSELFVNASGEETTAGLIQACQEAQGKRGAKHEMEFDVRLTEGVRWPRDWGLGDIVTAYYRGLRFDKKIKEIAVVVATSQSQPEEITLEFEDIT